MAQTIEEVTRLFPVEADAIFTPSSIIEIQKILSEYKGKISVWGWRYSMGWQTGIAWGAQIDMRKMNRIINFSKEKKEITVETGIRWRDIQDYIDPYDLSIMTMQTYSNFTVGGSLSVNVHGRYIGYGPLILSVKSIKIVLADGSIKMASRDENRDIFFGAIGGYGGIGIIVEATLELRDNSMLERVYVDMDVEKYGDFFRKNIRDDKNIIFHNGDIYPPHFSRVRATSWQITDKPSTTEDRLIPRNIDYSTHKSIYSMMAHTRSFITHIDYGKWLREKMIDPLVYSKSEIHSRNYEASYDVAELEPKSRAHDTYVLEEYFCPVWKIHEFVPKMREIFQRYDVNVINVSIRHALPDDGSFLAWASEEVFAFVVYYNQETNTPARREVAIWTRELIDVAIALWGRYYLPYQLHATLDQVKSAYPRWDEYGALKKEYDPRGKFSNSLLEKYYFWSEKKPEVLSSRFRTVYDTPLWRDKFYIFLQNIFRIAPTSVIHSAISDIVEKHETDEDIYLEIQNTLPSIKPFLADARYGIPALYKQKSEMSLQAKKLLGDQKITGYLEIWGAGRYIKPMRSIFDINSPIYLISDEPIDTSLVRILERGQIAHYNTKKLTYTDEDFSDISDESIECVTIFIGLHHCPIEFLDRYIDTLSRKMKKGAHLLLRDHNVESDLMHTFVAIAHDIYNAGTWVSWDTNQKELRHFRSTKVWKEKLKKFNLIKSGDDILQEHDPTINTLMHFIKT
jgi:FAD/FMN-containing dehydrogenase